MKTKEISFDVIQKIKGNNFLLEKLSEIDDIMFDLYLNRSALDIDYFNDEKDQDLNYWHSFQHCIEMYQSQLLINSKLLML